MNDKIQQLKSIVGYAAKQMIIHGYGLEKKGQNYKCPNPAAHKNSDNNPSFSWDNQKNHFYCFTCSHIIDIYNYYTEIEGKGFIEIMKQYNLLDKEEKKVPSNIQNNKVQSPKLDKKGLDELNQTQLDYIKTRGINPDTIKGLDVKNYNGKIAFTYKRNDEIIGIKLRAAGKVEKSKRFGAVAGSNKKNFWNQENVNLEKHKTLIVCEGEFDAIVMIECGYKNVVSVPDGVKSSKNVIDQEKKWLDKFKNIILLSDNDNPGKDMDKTFIDKLGYKVKLVDKSLMGNGSDINQEFHTSGKEKIDLIVRSASLKIPGFRDLSAQPYTGVKNQGKKYIPTGIDSIDYQINDLESRRLTLITGRPAEGKSTFVQQVLLNSIDKNHPVCLIDGEHHQDELINGLYMQLIGRQPQHYNSIQDNKLTIKEPKEQALKALQKWHKDKLFIYSRGEGDIQTIEQLFDTVRVILTHNNTDLVILDNLMSLLTFEATENELTKQKEFMLKCKDLCLAYNVHIIVVAHTNKNAVAGKKVDGYDVSGSSNIINIVDNAFHVSKVPEEEVEEKQCNGHIHLIKARRRGAKCISVDTFYDDETYTLLEKMQDGAANYKGMDWEKYLDVDYKEKEKLFEECPF